MGDPHQSAPCTGNEDSGMATNLFDNIYRELLQQVVRSL